MQQKLVLFDIDGTLLYSTSPLLRGRFTYAMEKVYGTSHEIDWEHIEGHTDMTVFLSTLTKKGLSKEEIQKGLPQAFELIYQHFSDNVGDDYKESILPGAKEILETLKDKVHIGTLTGNVEKIAWHKLDLVGLRSYFEFGLFGHEAEDRPSLARLVHAKAKKHFGMDFKSDSIYFIGDTPRDIACAREIGAKVIIVTTGKYKKDELMKHKPDLLVANLNDPKILTFIFNDTI